MKRALSSWVYPSIVREKVHDVSIFGVLRDALSARQHDETHDRGRP